MFDNFFIRISLLCHALGTILAQANTMAITAAFKYKGTIFHSTDIHIINLIISCGNHRCILIGICVFRNTQTIQFQIFAIHSRKSSFCFSSNAICCRRRSQITCTAALGCLTLHRSTAGRRIAAFSVDREHLTGQTAAGTGKISTDVFFCQCHAAGSTDNFHFLHTTACGDFRNNDILRTADIFAFGRQQAIQLR